MKFDDAIEKVLDNEDYNTDGLSVDNVITLIEYLRLEYAPTAEMTNEEVKEWGFDIDKFDKKEVDMPEKRYVWTSKKSDIEGQHLRLWMTSWEAVSTSFVEQGETFSENEKLTESEIRAWGYNPEMFEREEV